MKGKEDKKVFGVVYRSLEDALKHSEDVWSDDNELSYWRREIEWDIDSAIDDAEEYGVTTDVLNELRAYVEYAEEFGANATRADKFLEAYGY